MVIVVLLSFGRTQRDGRPVFGTTLANYDALWNEVYLRLFLRSLTYALATTLSCAPDRLPGRLRDRPCTAAASRAC